MIVNDSKKSPKIPKKFECKNCYYITSNCKDYNKHLTTDKHKKRSNDSKMIVNDGLKIPKIPKMFVCDCGKNYKFDSGLYRHRKICILTNNIDNANNVNNITNSANNIITNSANNIIINSANNITNNEKELIMKSVI